jgi:hypothetical protein
MTPLSCGLASTAAVATPVPASSTADMLPIRMALLLILIMIVYLPIPLRSMASSTRAQRSSTHWIAAAAVRLSTISVFFIGRQARTPGHTPSGCRRFTGRLI